MNGSSRDTMEALLESRLVLLSVPEYFTPSITEFYQPQLICGRVWHVPVNIVPPGINRYLVKKWSPLREYFNYKLTSARERGIIDVLTRRRNFNANLNCHFEFKYQFSVISNHDIVTAFAVVGFAALVALLALVVEKTLWFCIVNK